LVGALHLANGDSRGPELFLEQRVEIRAFPRTAAEYVEAERSVLGKRMTRDVRFSKQTDARDPARVWELMPVGFPEWMQVQVTYQVLEQLLETALIAQGGGVAAVGFHDPFEAAHVFRRLA